MTWIGWLIVAGVLFVVVMTVLMVMVTRANGGVGPLSLGQTVLEQPIRLSTPVRVEVGALSKGYVALRAGFTYQRSDAGSMPALATRLRIWNAGSNRDLVIDDTFERFGPLHQAKHQYDGDDGWRQSIRAVSALPPSEIGYIIEATIESDRPNQLTDLSLIISGDPGRSTDTK